MQLYQTDRPISPTQWGFYAVLLAAVSAIGYSEILDLPFTQDDQVVFGISDIPTLRLIGIGLHVCASLVTAWGLTRVGVSPAVGMMAGLLFAVGVGHYQVVHRSGGVLYSAVLILGMWSTQAFARRSNNRSIVVLLASPVVILVATFLHPVAFVFVPLAMLCALYAGEGPIDVLRRARSMMVAGLVPVIYLSVYADLAARIAGVSLQSPLVWLSYLGGTFLTGHVLIHPPITAGSIWACAAAVVLVVLAIVALTRTGSGIPALALAWSGAAVIPFVFAWAEILESRYLYLASVGIALAVAWILLASGGRRSRKTRTVRYVVAGFIIVTSVVQVRSAAALSHIRYARHLLAKDQHVLANVHYRRAYAIDDDLLSTDDYVRLTKASFYADESPDRILTDVWETRSDPDLVFKALVGLSKFAAASLDSHQVGQRLLNEAMTGSPRPDAIRELSAGVFRNLGVSRYKRGLYLKSGEAFNYSSQLDPERIDLQVWKVRAFWKAGEAQVAANTVLEMLDERYKDQKGASEAVALVHEMIREDKWEAGLWRLLAAAYRETGNYYKGLWATVQAIALVEHNPDDYRFLNELIALLSAKEGPMWTAVDLLQAIKRVDIGPDRKALIESSLVDKVVKEAYNRL
jgi:tetratricopeptide (TPR) repeat protein